MIRGIYRHYKGNNYLVEAVARHTETLEEQVVYRSLYGDFKWWTRPRKMFEETLEYQGKTVKRFTFIEDPSVTPPLSTH